MEQVLITSDGSLLEDIDLSPATVIEDVVQNIATILATIKGTIPYMRGFGRNRETEGRPMPVVFQLTTSRRGRQQFVTKSMDINHRFHNKSHNKSLFFALIILCLSIFH